MVNENLKEKIIEQIIDMEWEMFRSVKTSEPAACRELPGTFRSMRWMSHSVLPGSVLESYLLDLRQAAVLKRNLMTEKYARMQGLIPPLQINAKIAEITAVESRWMAALAELYPRTFRGVLQGFGLYESCELETYSGRTIDLYHEAVLEAQDKGRNLVEERYTNLFRRLGYDSIQAMEERAEGGIHHAHH
jgi:hypothetical protein